MRQAYLAEVEGPLVEAIRRRSQVALLETEARRRGLVDVDALRADLATDILVTDADLEGWKAENDWTAELEGQVVQDRIETAFGRDAAVDPSEVEAWIEAHPGTDPWAALVVLMAERLGIAADAVAELQAAEPALDEAAARLRLVQEEAGRRAAIVAEDDVTQAEIAAFLTEHPDLGDEALRQRIRDERADARLSALALRLWTDRHARLAVVLPVPERVDVPDDGDPAWGPAEAPVRVLVFSDFQCPFCARLHGTLQDLRAHYGERVRFVFFDLPLEFHPRALPAALAANCAAAQGRYEAMQTLLFEHQDALEDPDLERYAALADLNVPDWRACVALPATRAEIDGDIEAGEVLGLTGVPTVYVNGIAVQGARPFETFVEIIDRELAR
jgi:protein-disulfide isomerase